MKNISIGFWPCVAAAAALAAPAWSQCVADLNGDRIVNGADLGILLAAWGNCPGPVVPSWATLVEAQPDPAVVTDPALRAAIAATGLAWRVRDTGTQIEMLLIPPGTFQMGCIMGSNQYGCNSWEQPVHTVTLTNAFYLGRYEVTQSQWVAKMGSNPSYFQASNGFPDSASRPVERVSWTAIQGYLGVTGMRLPTEAEWEYACRAGTQTPFYNGSTNDSTVGTLAWYSPNAGNQTRPVGGKAANGFGLHDMLGNVYEWVSDWYDAYPSSAQTNPTGPVSASDRVIRGGAYSNGTDFVRSSYRIYSSPGVTLSYIGFRVARTP
jgi:formylglycine-generating enzyme required for sulfatase activity